MGRQTAATACATTLEALGWRTSIFDPGRASGPALRPAAATARALHSVPGLFDAIHYAALRTGSRLAGQADAAMRIGLVPGLRDHLDRNPVELVLSVSPAGASAVSAVAPRYPSTRHVVFCTDALPHRLWIQPHVDLYLVTSAAAEPAVLRFQPQARVRVMAPPVRAEFYRPPAQRSARAGLVVPEHGRCVLLIGGSRGLGPLAEIADGLAAADLTVLAVAGFNARAERGLKAVRECHPGVQVFGFTDRMPELMAAADLVITSPGATCTEARTVGRPLLLMDLIQGHGRDNLQHELELGDAAVTSKRPQDVVRSALAVLDRIKPAAAGPTRSLADWEDQFRLALADIVP